MRKLDNKLKIFLIVGIVSLCVLVTLVSKYDDVFGHNRLPDNNERNNMIENAYLDMSIEQLLEVVVDETTSAAMSRESLCKLMNDSCVDIII